MHVPREVHEVMLVALALLSVLGQCLMHAQLLHGVHCHTWVVLLQVRYLGTLFPNLI